VLRLSVRVNFPDGFEFPSQGGLLPENKVSGLPNIFSNPSGAVYASFSRTLTMVQQKVC